MLSGKQRRYLRGLGHHLQPVVQVGKGQVTEGLVSALGAALHDHELIKVRLGESVEGERDDVGEELAKAAAADLVQVIGRTVLLYKQREKDPEIVLPKR